MNISSNSASRQEYVPLSSLRTQSDHKSHFHHDLHSKGSGHCQKCKQDRLLARLHNLRLHLARKIHAHWMYEAASCFISLTSLLCLFILLHHVDKQAKPKWPDEISVNTIIAVITAILKASLMLPITEGISELKWHWYIAQRPLGDMADFDAASRGPWGSLLFLFRWKPHFLASFGALITLIALAIDPFSQQIIRYEECYIPLQSRAAQVPRTNNYTSVGTQFADGTWAVSDSMGLAVRQGLLTSGLTVSNLIPVNCPSGNCTFAAQSEGSYSSLAICQKSYNITSSAKYQDNGSNETHHSFTSILDSGAYVSFPAYPHLSVATVALDGDKGILFGFEAIMISMRGNFPDYFATRVEFYPCVKTWSASVRNGKLTEDEVNSTALTLMSGNDDGWNVMSLISDRSMRNGTWSTCNSSASDCSWVFGYPSVYGLSRSLDGFFNRQTVNGTLSDGNKTALGKGNGDPWMQNLFANAGSNITIVQANMDNLALAITANIRVNGDEPVKPFTNYATGTIISKETCIHVRWHWLILPASLVVCALVFFVLIVVFISRADTETGMRPGPYKSSPLPLLFCDIRAADGAKLTALDDMIEMEQIAGGLRVKLIRDPSNMHWTLVQKGKDGESAF